MFDELIYKIKKYYTEKRYEHALSVYNECRILSDMFSLNKECRKDLLTAALLHDISKKYDNGCQEELASNLGIVIPDDDLLSPKTVHAFTGAYLAKKAFPDLVNDVVFHSISVHTTGCSNMNITDKLLYLADYIEPKRDFPDCILLRDFFYKKDYNSSLHEHLDDTLIFSFDLTINQLIKEKQLIHYKTIEARNYLLKTKQERK